MADSYQVLNLFTSGSPYMHIWNNDPDGTDTFTTEANPVLPVGAGTPSAVAYSGDGRWLAIATSVTGHKIELFKRIGPNWVWQSSWSGNYTIARMALSYDGQWLAFNTGTVYALHRTGNIFDAAGEVSVAASTTSTVLDISPDGSTIACCNSSNPWYLRVYRNIATVWTNISPSSSLVQLCNGGVKFSPSGDYLAVAQQNGPGTLVVCVISGANVVSIADSASWTGGSDQVAGLAWSGQNDKVVLRAAGGTPAYYYSFSVDPSNGDVTYDGNIGVSVGQTISSIAYSPDGKYIAMGLGGSPWTKLVKVVSGVHSDLGAFPSSEANGSTTIHFSASYVAGQVEIYSTALARLISGTVDFASLKLVLLDDTATFNMDDTQLDEVTNSGSAEVSTTDWPSGGIDMVNFRSEVVSGGGGDVVLTFDETGVAGITVPTSFYYLCIYDSNDPDDAPLAFIDMGGEKFATVGQEIQISVTSDGLIYFDR